MARLASRRFVAVVGTGYLASIAAYSRLPGPAFSDPDSQYLVVGRPLIAFLLPTTAALIYLLLHRVWARDPVRDADEAFEPTYDAILFAVALFIVAIHLMVLATLTAAWPAERVWLMRTTVVLFGLLVARIGNLLPRTRPNLAFGIRTPRTLADRRLWMKTHRIAGYLAVSLGALFVVSGAFLSKQAIGSVLGPAVLGAAAFLVVAHYKYSRLEQSS